MVYLVQGRDEQVEYLGRNFDYCDPEVFDWDLCSCRVQLLLAILPRDTLLCTLYYLLASASFSFPAYTI